MLTRINSPEANIWKKHVLLNKEPINFVSEKLQAFFRTHTSHSEQFLERINFQFQQIAQTGNSKSDIPAEKQLQNTR